MSKQVNRDELLFQEGINHQLYGTFIRSARHLMQSLTKQGFTAEEVYNFLHTRLLADV